MLPSTAEEYLAFSARFPSRKERTEDQGEEITLAYKNLPSGERHRVKRIQVEAYFVPENLSPEAPRESFSPSGRYRLVVTSYGTQPGAWSYTRGEVYRVSDGTLLADVKRNYSSFPAVWVEDHPTGHDFLVTGEDYQGQTILDLTTGQRRDYLPETAEKGHGFCWVIVKPSPDKTLLVVNGCYWACPYEYKFFDFSDPIGKGWSEITDGGFDFSSDEGNTCTLEGDLVTWTRGEKVFKETGERYSQIEQKQSASYRAWSKSQKDGSPTEVVEAFKVAHDKVYADYPDEDEDADKWEVSVEHRLVCQVDREAGEMKLVSAWKSEYLRELENKQHEYREKENARMRKWQADDPLFQSLPKEPNRGRASFWYPSMDARDRGEPNPAFHSVSVSPYKEGRRRVGGVEWGVVEGDVRASLWTYGKGEDKSQVFPRTLEGVREAWRVAVSHEESVK